MANPKGITKGTGRNGGITTGAEERSGIPTGGEDVTGITPGSESRGGITSEVEGRVEMTGLPSLAGYWLANGEIPLDKVLVLVQRHGVTYPSLHWRGYVLQDYGWDEAFQTTDWRDVLKYASVNQLLIKQAYKHELVKQQIEKYLPLAPSNWLPGARIND